MKISFPATTTDTRTRYYPEGSFPQPGGEPRLSLDVSSPSPASVAACSKLVKVPGLHSSLHKPLCCNLQSIHSSLLLHLELLRLTLFSPSSASSLSSFRRYQRLSIPLFSYQGHRRQCQSSSPKNSTPHSPALFAGILGIVLCIAATTMRSILILLQVHSNV